MVEYKFSLELTKNGIQKSIHAKAGEGNSRKLVITLTEAGKVFELSGLNARVFLEDGTYIEDGVSIIGNTVEFMLPGALIAYEGIRFCEIKLFKGEDALYSPMIEVIVEKSLGNISYEEATKLGQKIQYQELIKATNYKENAEMSKEDSVVIYDSATDTVMRLTWSQLREIHNKKDSHPIDVISGIDILSKALNDKMEEVSAKTDKNIDAVKKDIDTIKQETGKVKKIFIPYDMDFSYGCYSFAYGSDVPLYATNNFLNEFGLSNILPVGLTVLWKGAEMSIAELNYKTIVGVPSASHVTLLDPVDVDRLGKDKLFAIIHNADGIGDTLLYEAKNENPNGYISGVYLYYFEKIEDVN